VPDTLDEPLAVDEIDPNELCDATPDRVATLADELTEAVVPLDRVVVPVRERVVVVEGVIVGVRVGVCVGVDVNVLLPVCVIVGVGVLVNDPVAEPVGVRDFVGVGERVGDCVWPVARPKKTKQIRILQSIICSDYTLDFLFISEVLFNKIDYT
jgi:hypothetical protein